MISDRDLYLKLFKDVMDKLVINMLDDVKDKDIADTTSNGIIETSSILVPEVLTQESLQATTKEISQKSTYAPLLALNKVVIQDSVDMSCMPVSLPNDSYMMKDGCTLPLDMNFSSAKSGKFGLVDNGNYWSLRNNITAGPRYCSASMSLGANSNYLVGGIIDITNEIDTMTDQNLCYVDSENIWIMKTSFPGTVISKCGAATLSSTEGVVVGGQTVDEQNAKENYTKTRKYNKTSDTWAAEAAGILSGVSPAVLSLTGSTASAVVGGNVYAFNGTTWSQDGTTATSAEGRSSISFSYTGTVTGVVFDGRSGDGYNQIGYRYSKIGSNPSTWSAVTAPYKAYNAVGISMCSMFGLTCGGRYTDDINDEYIDNCCMTYLASAAMIHYQRVFMPKPVANQVSFSMNHTYGFSASGINSKGLMADVFRFNNGSRAYYESGVESISRTTASYFNDTICPVPIDKGIYIPTVELTNQPYPVPYIHVNANYINPDDCREVEFSMSMDDGDTWTQNYPLENMHYIYSGFPLFSETGDDQYITRVRFQLFRLENANTWVNSNTTTNLPSLIVPRVGATGISLSPNYGLVCGGSEVSTDSTSRTILKSSELFDKIHHVWVRKAQFPNVGLITGNQYGSDFSVYEGAGYLCGGEGKYIDEEVIRNTCALYNMNSDSWTLRNNSIVSFSRSASLSLNNNGGAVIITGRKDGSAYSSDCYGYNISANTWSPYTILPSEAQGRTGLSLTDFRGLSCGGSDGTSATGNITYFDFYNMTWSSSPSDLLLLNRQFASGLNLTSDYGIICGGTGQSNDISEMIIMSSKISTARQKLQERRFKAAGISLTRDTGITCGGSKYGTPLSTIELYTHGETDFLGFSIFSEFANDVPIFQPSEEIIDPNFLLWWGCCAASDTESIVLSTTKDYNKLNAALSPVPLIYVDRNRQVIGNACLRLTDDQSVRMGFGTHQDIRRMRFACYLYVRDTITNVPVFDIKSEDDDVTIKCMLRDSETVRIEIGAEYFNIDCVPGISTNTWTFFEVAWNLLPLNGYAEVYIDSVKNVTDHRVELSNPFNITELILPGTLRELNNVIMYNNIIFHNNPNQSALYEWRGFDRFRPSLPPIPVQPIEHFIFWDQGTHDDTTHLPKVRFYGDRQDYDPGSDGKFFRCKGGVPKDAVSTTYPSYTTIPTNQRLSGSMRFGPAISGDVSTGNLSVEGKFITPISLDHISIGFWIRTPEEAVDSSFIINCSNVGYVPTDLHGLSLQISDTSEHQHSISGLRLNGVNLISAPVNFGSQASGWYFMEVRWTSSNFVDVYIGSGRIIHAASQDIGNITFTSVYLGRTSQTQAMWRVCNLIISSDDNVALLKYRFARQCPYTRFTMTPSAGANGSITPSNPVVTPAGTTITLNSTPSEHYVTNSWASQGGALLAAAPTLESQWNNNEVLLNGDVSVSVDFMRSHYNLRTWAGEHGTITQDGSSAASRWYLAINLDTHNAIPQTIDLAATPQWNNDGHYRVKEWEGDVTNKQTKGTTNTVYLDKDSTAGVTFENSEYLLSTYVRGNPPNGTISPNYPSPGTWCEANRTYTITAIPARGYKVFAWYDDVNDKETKETTNTVTLNANKTASVAFDISTFDLQTIVEHASGFSGGSLLPAGTTQQTAYSVVNLSARMNNADPDINIWKLTWTNTDNDTSRTSSNTVTMNGDKTGNGAVKINFDKWIRTLSASVPSGNGSIILNPSGGAYYAGTAVGVTAVPNDEYKLSGWTGPVTNKSGNTGTVNLYNQNESISASFARMTIQPSIVFWWAGTNIGGNLAIRYWPNGAHSDWSPTTQNVIPNSYTNLSRAASGPGIYPGSSAITMYGTQYSGFAENIHIDYPVAARQRMGAWMRFSTVSDPPWNNGVSVWLTNDQDGMNMASLALTLFGSTNISPGPWVIILGMVLTNAVVGVQITREQALSWNFYEVAHLPDGRVQGFMNGVSLGISEGAHELSPGQYPRLYVGSVAHPACTGLVNGIVITSDVGQPLYPIANPGSPRMNAPLV